MADTTKPNGDRDRPSYCEAAKSPRGLAMGPPEGTAWSGSTSPPLDMALLRELAAEFGLYPANVKPGDIERTRAQLAEHDRWRARAEASSIRAYSLPLPQNTARNSRSWPHPQSRRVIRRTGRPASFYSSGSCAGSGRARIWSRRGR